MAAAGGSLTLSQVRSWDTTHLTEAAAFWTKTATVWEDRFTDFATQIKNPGGIPWEGAAAEAAQQLAHADRMTVIGLADQLHSASAIARAGATQLDEASRLVLRTVDAAERAGFTVGEDFSVTDPRLYDPATAVARQVQAEAFATDLRATVGTLAATDEQIASQLTAATTALGADVFPDSGNEPSTVQMVTNKKAPAPRPSDDPGNDNANGEETPGARGLPPPNVRPPVEGPLTEGPASRARERRFGGQSLWDENGGEWRYFPGDAYHNPHWDYNPHSTPSGRGSDWENIPIDGLPPRTNQSPVISALPPWLQGPAVQAAPMPGQNPLLTPFPGASIPTSAPPTASPAVEPGLIPHINFPTPHPGALPNADGPAAVLGGGLLLLTLLGAMALA